MSLFSSEVVSKIEHYLTRYETRRSAILPVLHVIQDTYEWIRPEHIDALEKEFQLSRVDVQEVATFYSMYRMSEPKPFRIQFCDNIVCTIRGAKKTMKKIESCLNKQKAKDGSTPFSLEGVPCLGVCDGAPAMLINKDRYLNVDENQVEDILSKYSH